ncbi:hypothetical protein CHU70_11065 (plasmid) [Corynebacterium sp. LK10]|uniref:hypothetical protein n=1 Tax=Corynebacterium sp. LK10 TaxID=2022656 RepID=UPI0011C86A70|nr:hypothetical protein [Corynebacterium sp. LK10]TXS81799.1 hypothetical protein CHU70_11065 [Corynebacterium sp. LK10]
MEQQSYLIVNIHTVKNGERVKSVRIARHYQWVWGQFLIFRANRLARFLHQQARADYNTITSEELEAAIPAIYGMNIINGDVQGISPSSDAADCPLKWMAPFNGYVVVDVTISSFDRRIDVDVDFTMGIIERQMTDTGTEYVLITPGDYMAQYATLDMRDSDDWRHISKAVISLEALLKDRGFASGNEAADVADSLAPTEAEIEARPPDFLIW